MRETIKSSWGSFTLSSLKKMCCNGPLRETVEVKRERNEKNPKKLKTNLFSKFRWVVLSDSNKICTERREIKNYKNSLFRENPVLNFRIFTSHNNRHPLLIGILFKTIIWCHVQSRDNHHGTLIYFRKFRKRFSYKCCERCLSW